MESSDGIGSGPLLQLLHVRTSAKKAEPFRVTVHDTSFVYEVIIAEGGIRGATRVGADGSFVGGQEALDLLASLKSGRFVIDDGGAPQTASDDSDTDAMHLGAYIEGDERPVVAPSSPDASHANADEHVSEASSGVTAGDQIGARASDESDRISEPVRVVSDFVGSPFVDGDETMSEPVGETAALRFGYVPSFGAMVRRKRPVTGVQIAKPAFARAGDVPAAAEGPLVGQTRRGGVGYVALVFALAAAGAIGVHLFTRARTAVHADNLVDSPARSDVVQPEDIVLPELEHFPAADEPTGETPPGVASAAPALGASVPQPAPKPAPQALPNPPATPPVIAPKVAKETTCLGANCDGHRGAPHPRHHHRHRRGPRKSHDVVKKP